MNRDKHIKYINDNYSGEMRRAVITLYYKLYLIVTKNEYTLKELKDIAFYTEFLQHLGVDIIGE